MVVGAAATSLDGPDLYPNPGPGLGSEIPRDTARGRVRTVAARRLALVAVVNEGGAVAGALTRTGPHVLDVSSVPLHNRISKRPSPSTPNHLPLYCSPGSPGVS